MLTFSALHVLLKIVHVILDKQFHKLLKTKADFLFRESPPFLYIQREKEGET